MSASCPHPTVASGDSREDPKSVFGAGPMRSVLSSATSNWHLQALFSSLAPAALATLLGPRTQQSHFHLKTREFALVLSSSCCTLSLWVLTSCFPKAPGVCSDTNFSETPDLFIEHRISTLPALPLPCFSFPALIL